MKGIIYGLMRNYKLQNTREDDYHQMAIKLLDRHVARGWNHATIKEYILSADSRLQSGTPSKSSETKSLTTKERLFLHLEYHPNDIPRAAIRDIYDRHCQQLFEESLGIQQFTIAYSRPPNIHDTLTKAKLHQAKDKPASLYYSGELVEH